VTIVKPFTDSELRSRSAFLGTITDLSCHLGHPVNVEIRRTLYGLEANGNCAEDCVDYVWRWQRDKVKA